MTISVTITALSPEELHAKVLGLIGKAPPKSAGDAFSGPAKPVAILQDQTVGHGSTQASPEANAPAADPVPTAEVVPIAERKKPGRPKKTETVVDAEPAKNPEPTVEDARAVLKDIQTKIGNEEARQLNKKHGEEPLSEKKPAQWAAIIAEGKTLLAALDAE